MKVKVLRPFRNKYSKKIHKKGEVLNISKKRYEEIVKSPHKGLIEVVEEKEEKKKRTKSKKTKK